MKLNLKERVETLIDSYLLRMGYIKEEEFLLRAVPASERRRINSIREKLKSLSVLSDTSKAFELSKELCHILKSNSSRLDSRNRSSKDAVRLIGGDIYGYQPAAAQLLSLFNRNPFGVYAFVARHHWAVRSSLQVIRDELSNDGFQLRTEKGVTKKRLKDVYRQLKSMNIFKLRIDIACHIKLFGNAWVLPHKNLLGGAGALELLSPPRLMPIIDPVTDQILGWEYSIGRTTMVYPADKLFHIWQYTVDGYKNIGDPPLNPAILQIEADLNADNYNNMLFQKGGLMGIILNVKSNDSDPLAKNELDLMEELQDRIDAQYSGGKTGGAVLVTSNLESVHNVNPVGKLEGSFQALHMECAKTVANCLGVPPEKIAVSRSDSLQYIPSLVEDSVNASFDKSLNALISLVDEFLNDRVLGDMLGIYDVRIVASGRYGALTKNAADTIKTLAESGPIITVNQALDRVLGWEELPADNPRGRFILNNANLGGNAIPMPYKTDPEDPQLEFGKTVSSDKILDFANKIKSGTFEVKDMTRSEDSEIVDYLSVSKRGELKYYSYYKL